LCQVAVLNFLSISDLFCATICHIRKERGIRMSKTASSLCVLAAGVLWGCISLFLRPLTELGFSSIQSVAIRTTLSFIILFVFLGVTRPRLLKIRLKDIPLFIGTGMLSLLFFSLCYFAAIGEAGVSVAVVLLYTSPVFVMLMSAAFFGEKLTKVKLIALIMTLAGCVFVSGMLTEGQSIGIKALTLGLMSGFGYALYSIFGRIALRYCDTMTITVYTFAFAALGSNIAALLSQGAPVTALFVPEGMFAAFGIALFCCVAPYLLYTKGLAGIETGRAAILAAVEPVVGMLIGVFIFSEGMTAVKFIGMALILTSIVMLSKE